MKQIILGNTKLTATPLGLGLAALGRPGYINIGHGRDLGGNTDSRAMKRNAYDVLDAAWNAGIRYFDTARSYGKAENYLGAWLKKRGIPAHAVAVGSKWGYTYTADWQVQADTHEVKEHSLPVLQRQWQESKAELGDHLGLYQIHSATVDSGVLNNKEVLDQLHQLRRNGMQIGITLSGENQKDTLRKALKSRVDGELLFTSVQVTYNILEQSTDSLLRTAHDMGMGIIAKETLANGRLTNRNGDGEFAGKKAQLEGLAQECQTTLDALAIGFVHNQPFIDIALSGATTPQHIQSNTHALDINWSNDLTQTLRRLSEDKKEYWSKRSRLAWN